jgi:hypothetical protein
MTKTLTSIAILILAVSSSSHCQLAAGYNTDGNTLALSYNPLEKLAVEFRVNTKPYNQAEWEYSDRGITQLYGLFQFFSSGNVSLYAGGGMGVNFLSEDSDKWLSVNIPIGIRINPFASLPDLFIIGEYDPMIVTNEDIPMIHCMSLGFRYMLTRKQ